MAAYALELSGTASFVLDRTRWLQTVDINSAFGLDRMKLQKRRFNEPVGVRCSPHWIVRSRLSSDATVLSKSISRSFVTTGCSGEVMSSSFRELRQRNVE